MKKILISILAVLFLASFAGGGAFFLTSCSPSESVGAPTNPGDENNGGNEGDNQGGNQTPGGDDNSGEAGGNTDPSNPDDGDDETEGKITVRLNIFSYLITGDGTSLYCNQSNYPGYFDAHWRSTTSTSTATWGSQCSVTASAGTTGVGGASGDTYVSGCAQFSYSYSKGLPQPRFCDVYVSENSGYTYAGCTTSSPDDYKENVPSTTNRKFYITYNGITSNVNTAISYAKEKKNITQTVYLIFRKNYTNTYNNYNGQGGTTTQTVEAGSTYMTKNYFEKNGYRFGGWEDKDAGVIVNPNATLTCYGSRTFNAYYIIEQYTLTLRANGGDAISPSSMTYNITSVNRLPTPTRTGHDFTGWKPKTSAGNWSSGTTYSAGKSLGGMYGNVTLEAQWQIKTYTLTVNYNSLSASNSTDINVTCGSEASFTVTPTYSGSRTFSYSTTQMRISIVRTNSSYDYYIGESMFPETVNRIEFYWTPTADRTVTLYVYQRYTISYNANGGDGNVADTYKRYGSTAYLSSSTFTKTGYTQTGWRRWTATGPRYELGGGFIQNSNESFYAEWRMDSYTLTLNANGGSVSPTSTSVSFGSSYSLPTPTRTGHTFAGWSHTSGPGTLSGSSFRMGAGNATVTANWTINSYSLSINPNGGSWNGSPSTSTIPPRTYGSKYSLSAPTREGYTFAGWAPQDNSTWLDGLKASYHVAGLGSVNVYNNNGNGAVTHTVVSDSSVGAGKSLRITTNGSASPYAGGFNQYFDTAANETYIHWFRAKVPVGYMLYDHSNSIGDGGSFTWLTSQLGTGNWETYAYKIQTGSSGSFSSTGFVSAHAVYSGSDTSVTWWLYESYAFRVSSNGVFHFGGRNETIVALWSPNKYKVTLDNQDATTAGTTAAWYEYNTMKNTHVSSNTYYYSDEGCNTPLSGGANITCPTKTGYTFGGYYTSPTGTECYVDSSGAFINNLYKNEADNSVLYAKWTPTAYSVNINVYMPDRVTEPYQTGEAGFFDTIYYSDGNETYNNAFNERSAYVAYGSTIVFTNFHPGRGMKYLEQNHSGAGEFRTNTAASESGGGKWTFTVLGDASINFYTDWNTFTWRAQAFAETEPGSGTYESVGGVANFSGTYTNGSGTSTPFSYSDADSGEKTALRGHSFSFNVSASSGWTIAAFSTSWTGSVNTLPAQKLMQQSYSYSVDSPNEDIHLYIWLQKVVNNQLLYDPSSGMHYFEDGEYPQESASDKLIEMNENTGYYRINESVSSDFLRTIATSGQYNFTAGTTLRATMTFVSGSVTNYDRGVYILQLLNSSKDEVARSENWYPHGVRDGGSDTISIDITSSLASTAKYAQIYLYCNGYAMSFNDCVFNLTVECDFSQLLETNKGSTEVVATGTSFKYTDDNGEEQSMPVYTYGGKKYARAANMNGESRWFKVQPIRWRVNETEHTFNGANYINLGRKYMYTDKFTMNMWAYKDDWNMSDVQNTISCTEGGGWNLYFASSGLVECDIWDAGTNSYKSVAVTGIELSSGWHMFTLTFDGAYTRLYVDGVLKGTSAKFSGKLGYNPTNSMFIGAEAGGRADVPEEHYFQGKIKNVKIANAAYSADEIAALYATGGLDKQFESFDALGAYNEDFTVVSDKVLGFGAVLGLDAKGNEQHAQEGWNFSDSTMFKQTQTLASSTGVQYSSDKIIHFNGSFKPAGTQKVIETSWAANVTTDAHIKQNGLTFDIIEGSETFTYFKVQRYNGGSYIDECGGTASNGIYTGSFVKNSETTIIQMGFNGVVSYDAKILIDVSSLANGTYTFKVVISNFSVRGNTGTFKILDSTAGGVRVASTEEIDSVMGLDARAKQTDLVAFLSGWGNGGEYAEYWTRSLGDQLDTGKTITAWGERSQAWLQTALGVRYAMTMSEGSNNGGVGLRYIRVTSNGSSSNEGNYLQYLGVNTAGGGTEIVAKAYGDIGRDKIVCKDGATGSSIELSSATDEDAAYFTMGWSNSGPWNYIADIGRTVAASSVTLSNYWPDGRHFYALHLEGSVDGVNWYNIWNSYNTGSYGNDVTFNTYAETKGGRTFEMPFSNGSLLDMEDLMSWFNWQEYAHDNGTTGYIPMTKNADGSYTWCGPTGGYWEGSSFKVYQYNPGNLKPGLYRMSYHATTNTSNTTTAILPKNKQNQWIWSQDALVTNSRTEYSYTFVVNEDFVGFELPYSYGNHATFSNIKLEYVAGGGDILSPTPIENNNLLKNTNFEDLEDTGDPGWDNSLNNIVGNVAPRGWSTANMGVGNSSTGYHSHMNYDSQDGHGYVIEMINKAPSLNRWIGTSTGIDAGVIQAGHTYTIQMDLKAVEGTPYIFGGLYCHRRDVDGMSFHAGQFGFNAQKDWSTFTWTFTAPTDLDETWDSGFFIYGQGGGTHTCWIDNVYLYEAGGGN